MADELCGRTLDVKSIIQRRDLFKIASIWLSKTSVINSGQYYCSRSQDCHNCDDNRVNRYYTENGSYFKVCL